MGETEREILLNIIKSQNKQIEELTARIEELKRQNDEKKHKKNSRNSSVPSSQEGYSKPAPKSRRKSSGAKSGGQNGHSGNSMKIMKEPDEIREHYPEPCNNCPNRACCHAVVAERRYETDIIVETRLTEHRQMVCCCGKAGNVRLLNSYLQ